MLGVTFSKTHISDLGMADLEYSDADGAAVPEDPAFGYGASKVRPSPSPPARAFRQRSPPPQAKIGMLGVRQQPPAAASPKPATAATTATATSISSILKGASAKPSASPLPSPSPTPSPRMYKSRSPPPLSRALLPSSKKQDSASG